MARGSMRSVLRRSSAFPRPTRAAAGWAVLLRESTSLNARGVALATSQFRSHGRRGTYLRTSTTPSNRSARAWATPLLSAALNGRTTTGPLDPPYASRRVTSLRCRIPRLQRFSSIVSGRVSQLLWLRAHTISWHRSMRLCAVRLQMPSRSTRASSSSTSQTMPRTFSTCAGPIARPRLARTTPGGSPRCVCSGMCYARNG